MIRRLCAWEARHDNDGECRLCAGVLAALVMMLLLLAACDNSDPYRCLRSHYEERQTTDMLWAGQTCVNNICTPIYIYVPRTYMDRVCTSRLPNFARKP